MFNKLFDELNKKKIKIISAESITGGKFISNIIKISGASNIVYGSYICYSNEYKYNVLNVDKDIEIVSEEMSKQLAINSFNKSISKNKLISISFTGNASPNGIENKLQGLTYISIYDGKIINTYKYISKKNKRKDIILDTSNYGAEILLKFIKKNLN